MHLILVTEHVRYTASCVVYTSTLLDCNLSYYALFVITITLITALHLHVMVGDYMSWINDTLYLLPQLCKKYK